MKDELEEIFGELREAVGPLETASSAPSSTPAPPPALGASAYPTQMSCNQVFDLLLKCYSVGGQIRHYYRYGEMSYCQDKKDKLKFCMSTKLMGKEKKERAISEFYMKQLARQKADGHSSEQVWESREEPLRRPFREGGVADEEYPQM